tara:strand:+ start:3356 stop:3511 length:156 start_codon:yes stop_codon:yes gene_type:complete
MNDKESELFKKLLEARGMAFNIKEASRNVMISYVYEELNELVEQLIKYENE